MAFKHFNHLNVPDGWERYFTKYPQGMTILEALFEWVSQVDNMVDNQNKLNDNVAQFRNEIDAFVARFDDRLQTEVTQILNEWQNSGFLDVVISEALQWELDNYITTNEQDKLSLTAQLQQTTDEVDTLRNVKADITTSDFVFYVDGISGSNENNGESSSEAFKTIQKAIDTLPSIIKNHVVINVADGVYREQNEGYSGAHVDTIGTHMNKANIIFQNKHIHEGASITLIGNESNPNNVVLDGQGVVDNVFIMDMRRVNIKGFTFQNPSTYNVQYKRYASGQLKNCVFDGGQFGLWLYQYCFVEVQDGVIFRNHDTAIYQQTQSYFNGVGITIENTVRVGMNIGQNSSASFSQANNYFKARESNFLIGPNCSVDVTGMNITGSVGKNGGFLDMYNTTVQHTGLLDYALDVYRTGAARLINVTIESTTTPASTTHSGISVREASRLMMVGGTVKGFYNNVTISNGSSGYLENVDIANARYDGLSVTNSQVGLTNLSSTIVNGRNGSRFIRSIPVVSGLKGTVSNQESAESISTYLIFNDTEKPTENLFSGQLGFNRTIAKLMVYTGPGVGWVNVGS